MPDKLPWDTTRPYLNRSDAAVDYYNAGCPLGYFAELVPKGTPGATPLDVPTADIRCRAVSSTTPETLVGESADFAIENMTRFNAALQDDPGMFATPGTLAVLAGIGLFVYARMRGST